MKTMFYLVLFFIMAVQIHAQWVQTNGPYGGVNIHNLAIRNDLSGGRSIFASTESGIYISTDDGSCWRQIYFWPEYYYIYTIAVNDSFVFAGTNYGIYRSSDNGLSWSLAEPGLSDGAQAFTVCGKNIFAVSNGLVYISTNNGINWTGASIGLPGQGEISTLAVYGAYVFAGTYNNGIYLSTNNGVNWTAVNSGLPEMTKVYAFSMSGTNIFAGTMQGIYLSTNTGTSWARADSGIPRDQNGWSFIHALTVSGKNIYAGVSHTYYTSNRGIYLSTDNGVSWKDVSPHLSGNPFYISLSTSGKYVFAEARIGLYRTSDNGASWKESDSGIINTSISTLLINGSNLYTVSSQSVHLSTNIGGNWIKVGTFDSGFWDYEIITLVVLGKRLFAGGFFYYSTDGNYILQLSGGNEWIKADSGMSGGSHVSDLEVMGNILFAAAPGCIYVSKDSGASWTESSHGLPEINDLFISGTDIFAATEQGIYASSDSAKNWRLLYDPGIVKFLYVYGSHILAGTGYYIYHSEDYGKTWELANTRYSPMEYFTVIQKDGKNIIAATHNGRVYLTDNYCKKWTEATTGLPAANFPVCKINKLSAGAGYLFAGTTKGVWRRPLSEIITDVKSPPEVPVKFSLEQNYPNPFNPTTKIKFSLPYPSHVILKIYDLLGREIATLVNEEKPEGLHTAVWIADNISSGVYFYELRAGNFVEKRKMMLIR